MTALEHTSTPPLCSPSRRSATELLEPNLRPLVLAVRLFPEHRDWIVTRSEVCFLSDVTQLQDGMQRCAVCAPRRGCSQRAGTTPSPTESDVRRALESEGSYVQVHTTEK